MFRVRQSQKLSQKIEGLLSLFNDEDQVKTVKTTHTSPQKNTPVMNRTLFKRRRRARRFAGISDTQIRSTWF